MGNRGLQSHDHTLLCNSSQCKPYGIETQCFNNLFISRVHTLDKPSASINQSLAFVVNTHLSHHL